LKADEVDSDKSKANLFTGPTETHTQHVAKFEDGGGGGGSSLRH